MGLFLTNSLTTFAENNYKQLKMTGDAFLNIPQKDWTSMDQVEKVKAKTSITTLNVSDERIVIKGSIEYNGLQKNYSFSGNLMKSNQIQNDYILEFDDTKEFGIVHGAVRFSTPERKLILNKQHTGSTTLHLYFFDRSTKDLIMFEQPLPGTVKQQISRINYSSLGNALTDSFAHKIVKPKQKNNREESEKEINLDAVKKKLKKQKINEKDSSSEVSIMYGISDTDSASKTVNYDLGWGVATHSTTAYLQTHTSSSIQNQGDVNSTLTFDQWVDPADGSSREYGWSNIWLGRTNPVGVWYEVYGLDTNSRDIISKKYYGGNWSGDDLPSLGVSVGYGPISGGFSFSKSTTINKSNFENVWTYDNNSDYPFETKVDFTDTYLYHEEYGERYESNISLITNGTEGTKAVDSFWDVEFYDGFNHESLGVEYLYTYLQYSSQQS